MHPTVRGVFLSSGPEAYCISGSSKMIDYGDTYSLQERNPHSMLQSGLAKQPKELLAGHYCQQL
jgi:hypothetical protein